MSLPKTMENAGVRETSQVIHHSKDLPNLSNFVKNYGHLSEILTFLPQALTKYDSIT